MVINPRRHGPAPYALAVVHGGPGAPGSAAPLTADLSRAAGRGVLEPLQTAASVAGQGSELCALLERHAAAPVTLIGHSWGAWLSLFAAVRRPALVRKLILVGCPPFEECAAAGIMETRLQRLSEAEQRECHALMQALSVSEPDSPFAASGSDAALALFGALMARADAFDPLPPPVEVSPTHAPIPFQAGLHVAVWTEAAALRRSGALLRLLARVQCPVVAIHGADDPHPAEAVAAPLGRILPRSRFHLLERCGHEPWRERHACERFFEILLCELA